MIKSIRNNKNLKDNPYYKTTHTFKESTKPLVDHVKATPEVLQQIRDMVILEQKKEVKKSILAIILSLFVLIVAAFIIGVLLDMYS